MLKIESWRSSYNFENLKNYHKGLLGFSNSWILNLKWFNHRLTCVPIPTTLSFFLFLFFFLFFFFPLPLPETTKWQFPTFPQLLPFLSLILLSLSPPQLNVVHGVPATIRLNMPIRPPPLTIELHCHWSRATTHHPTPEATTRPNLISSPFVCLLRQVFIFLSPSRRALSTNTHIAW